MDKKRKWLHGTHDSTSRQIKGQRIIEVPFESTTIKWPRVYLDEKTKTDSYGMGFENIFFEEARSSYVVVVLSLQSKYDCYKNIYDDFIIDESEKKMFRMVKRMGTVMI